MSNVAIAAPQQQKIKPAFMVRKLEGEIVQNVITFDKTGKRVVETVKKDAGWLVTFPKGHSIRVMSEDQLRRLGFDRTIPLVDMESDGEIVGSIPNQAVA